MSIGPAAVSVGTSSPISLTGVTKQYRGGGGVVDVSLCVEAGEVFGFLGPNGAGKTTVVRLLMDLIRPDSGSIKLFGMDSRVNSVAIRRRVGYVPGELALYDRFTAREVLTHFAHLRGGLDWSVIAKPAELLKLEMDRPLRELSKGNRQKVGLAAALMGDPELLVLDEPTSGLDPLVQQLVHGELVRAASEGRTVFLSSHILAEVGEVADRVGLIRDGQLVAVAHVDELVQRAAHTVEATFAGTVDTSRFSNLEGVRSCVVSGNTLRVDVVGAIRPIVQALGESELVDLTIREPTLEEMFLAFYASDHG